MDVEMRNVERERTGIANLYPVGYELPAFEEAVGALALPQADEVVAACADFARALGAEGRLPAGVAEADARYLALHTFDYGAGAPERAHNPAAVLDEALRRRTVLALRRARHVLWGLLAALRRLPRAAHPALRRTVSSRIDPANPLYAPGSFIRWPSFATVFPLESTSSSSTTTKPAETTTEYIIRGPEGHQVWGYDLSVFSMAPGETTPEGALLLEPDACFRVVSATEATVELELVEDTPLLLGARIATPAQQQLEQEEAEKKAAAEKAEAEKKVAALQEAADGGDVEALVELAGCYANGTGVERDDARAAALYGRAADAGSAEAAYKLGWCYDTGFGVARDLARALALYTRAGDAGCAPALFNAAVCYYNGDGAAPDQARAAELYARAAALGHTKAMKNLAVCYSKGTGVPRDDARALALWQQAADAGDAGAMFDLALCYAHGTGVAPDPQRAIVLYQAAADLGNVNAIFNLGVCYDNGDGVPQDKKKALELFRKAAALGDFEALQRVQLANPGCSLQ